MSTTWFVGADWFAEHIDDPEIQIIDARMASPGQEDRNVAQEYLNGHIPGAVFFDIEALSDHTSPLPHMLPRPETFAVAMRELGVNQDKHLIVYDEGNLFSARLVDAAHLWCRESVDSGGWTCRLAAR